MTAVAPLPENPLLQAWLTPHETPPFEAIRPEHFLPAFEQAFADHAAEIAAIKAKKLPAGEEAKALAAFNASWAEGEAERKKKYIER